MGQSSRETKRQSGDAATVDTFMRASRHQRNARHASTKELTLKYLTRTINVDLRKDV
jgi:hypothetical protein